MSARSMLLRLLLRAGELSSPPRPLSLAPGAPAPPEMPLTPHQEACREHGHVCGLGHGEVKHHSQGRKAKSSFAAKPGRVLERAIRFRLLGLGCHQTRGGSVKNHLEAARF